MQSLPALTHEHHERIRAHIDRLPDLAEMVGHDDPDFAATLEEEHAFVVGRLVPHMSVIEDTLYGELERLMAGRHSMEPMRQEHEDLRRLSATLGELATRVSEGTLGRDDEMAMRRVLYRLYSILKVHLAEEELYLGVLDHNLSDEEKDALAQAIERACAQPV
jgi:hemerythrin-like domain-containing protein